MKKSDSQSLRAGSGISAGSKKEVFLHVFLHFGVNIATTT